MRLIGNVEKDAQVRAVASGALPRGDAVIVNADGTVSVVEGGPQALGTPVVFESATTLYTSATFDSNSNKVVVAYADWGNSRYGTAIVGTVSGTSISFGSPVVFESANTSNVSATFDSSSNKVVIAYTDAGNSNYGTAIVGTVSGTSISFGTPVVFESANTSNPYFSAVFDSNSNKVVIAYTDSGNSNYGTAIVGTVSGTSISFGSAVVFASHATYYSATTFDNNSNKVVIVFYNGSSAGEGAAIVGTVSGTSISFGSAVEFSSDSTVNFDATFDSNSNKVVIGYRNNLGSFSYGVVGTVSGTSISFGTPVELDDGSLSDRMSLTFDSSSNKVVIVYNDAGNSGYGTVIVGAVSGTSLSLSTPVVFETANTINISSTFDSISNKVVIAYRDAGNSSYGTAVVFKNESTTLTAENYIGFAAHTYAHTQSALVNSTCTVDRNQTGLTAGQTYYVQTDGSLGTTAANPSVVAGTAISSTEIIVKG